ncbi:uncharacterized [Lates japonicus]
MHKVVCCADGGFVIGQAAADKKWEVPGKIANRKGRPEPKKKQKKKKKTAAADETSKRRKSILPLVRSLLPLAHLPA